MAFRSVLIFAVVSLALALIASAQSSNLEGIAHLALRVNDLEKSRSFYEKLGFEQAFQFEESGKVTQAFIKINDRQFIELYPRIEKTQSIGFMHVCYEADHIEEVRAVYAMRVINAPDVKKARAGNLVLVLQDPEGQIVEYTQYLPGSMHWHDRGKHLGEQRVSTHLASVTIPVKDVTIERTFYVEKLGFDPGGSRRAETVLLIPGSDDAVALASAAVMNRAELRFTVRSTKQVEQLVRNAGLKLEMRDKSVVVKDPDENLVVLQGKPKHGDLVR